MNVSILGQKKKTLYTLACVLISFLWIKIYHLDHSFFKKMQNKAVDIIIMIIMVIAKTIIIRINFKYGLSFLMNIQKVKNIQKEIKQKVKLKKSFYIFANTSYNLERIEQGQRYLVPGIKNSLILVH